MQQMAAEKKKALDEAGFIGDPSGGGDEGHTVEIMTKGPGGTILSHKTDQTGQTVVSEVQPSVPAFELPSLDASNADLLAFPQDVGAGSGGVGMSKGGMAAAMGRAVASSSKQSLGRKGFGGGASGSSGVGISGGMLSPSRSSLPYSSTPLRAFRGTDWGMVEGAANRGDLVTAFSEVLDRGSLDDVAKLMEMVGPHPELLSVGTRNRVLDSVSMLLAQGGSSGGGAVVERCLVWVLALVRSKEGSGGPGGPGTGSGASMCASIVPHTRRDLHDALGIVAQEPSKRGMLASLLQSQLVKAAASGQ
jgi:hypothetical protein